MLDFGDPGCLDARLPGPGGRGRELELPTGQEILTALREVQVPPPSLQVQEGEYPNRLDPQNPVYAEETGPSIIVNGFSERFRASHSQRIWPNSENLVRSRAHSVPVQLALVNSHQIRSLVSVGDSIPRSTDFALWTEERVPESAVAHNHTDVYFAYHHRSFIWRRTAIQSETHIGAPD